MASNKYKTQKEIFETPQPMLKKVDSIITGRMRDVTQRRLRTLQMQYKLKENAPKKVGLIDFELIKVISKGVFGEILIVRNISDNVAYAMKRAERDLMSNINVAKQDIFLMKLNFFKDSVYLYLVPEYCSGDLMTILRREDILTEQQTKFYLSELSVAINAIHELDFVHRDLKPDNILIANNGHIKLSDFGLIKRF
eukprot:291075_1